METTKQLEREKELVGDLLLAGLKRRREVLVVEMARRFYSALLNHTPAGGGAESDEGWLRIESLSQLRATVGGRFRNLKQKWVEAGFPLREHRGDRSESGEVRTEGWMSLADWVTKQGFDVRLAPPGESWLFEVRSSAKNGE